jgi:hypothetical protein
MRTTADAAVDSAPDADRPDSPTSADAGQDIADSPDSSVDGTTSMANITFVFENAGTNTLYLHRGCTTPIRVTSLASGAVYGNSFFCACDCATPSCNGTLACGACAPDSGIPVSVGSSTEIPWTAQAVTSRSKTGPYGPFTCVDERPVPTGAYKVEIDVYTSSSDAENSTNPRTVAKLFVLGTADATVEVPLS